MTIDEKRMALTDYCNTQSELDCCECPLYRWEEIHCFFDKHEVWSDERIEEAYNAVSEQFTNTTVNHPTHYNRDGAMECIEEMMLVFGKEAVMHFCLCNAWKYRYRAADKNGEEDLKKSDWYLAKYRELGGE